MHKKLKLLAPPTLAFALAAICLSAALLTIALPSLTERVPGAHTGSNVSTSPGAPTEFGSRAFAGGAAAAGPRGLADGLPVGRTLFQPGSCILFAPTDGDRHRTVFLDAGHGGIDPGALGKTEAGQTIYEARLTLPVELHAAALLRSEGFTVVVSRTRDSLVGRLGPQDFTGGLLTPQGVHDDIAARDECADLARASVLVGIYFDAGGTPENAGCLTAYDRARPFWQANLRLSELVQRDVLSALDSDGQSVPDDGVTPDIGLGGPALDEAEAAYGHLLLLGPAEPEWFQTPSNMPGTLIEPLFITDPFEATIAASTAGQEAIARGIALAIEQYFALKAASFSPTTKE